MNSRRSKYNISEDLWQEILSRLPVQSLLRFRSVCKTWRSLIDEPMFERLHLNNLKNNLHEINIFVQYGAYNEDNIYMVHCSNTYQTVTSLGSPYETGLGEDWFVVGSVDGLVLLQSPRPTLKLLLWNPSIRKTRILPPSPKIDNTTNVDLGFGFDPLIQDYKQVRLVWDYKLIHSVAVYTLGTGLWKTRKIRDNETSDWPTYMDGSFISTVNFTGVLYFIVRRKDNYNQQLVSFDLTNEVFASLNLPRRNLNKIVNPGFMLGNFGQSLVVAYLSRTEGFIWVSESPRAHNDSMNWAKCYTLALRIPENDWAYPYSLYLKKNGDLLLQWVYRGLMSCNIETGEEFIVEQNGGTMRKIFHYKESLILLQG